MHFEPDHDESFGELFLGVAIIVIGLAAVLVGVPWLASH
jgi:ABC-type uncharacterized transport system permease subunit